MNTGARSGFGFSTSLFHGSFAVSARETLTKYKRRPPKTEARETLQPGSLTHPPGGPLALRIRCTLIRSQRPPRKIAVTGSVCGG